MWHWNKGRHMNQWNRIQGPIINPCLYQFIFFNKKRIVFWNNGIYTGKRVKLDLYLIPCSKINLKWIREQNLRSKTIKLLEEDIEVNLYELKLGNSTLHTAPKIEQKKIQQKKKILLDFIKIKNCAIKGHYLKSEKTIFRVGENICK